MAGTAQRVSCALVLALLAPLSAKAAIHGYSREPFTNAGNGAYIFRGGREGLFASTEVPYFRRDVVVRISTRTPPGHSHYSSRLLLPGRPSRYA